MFFGCESITNIKTLKNWQFSRCKDISGMFYHCNISDIKILENWNVSNVTDFHELLYIKP